jgi:hypothetical protein
VNTPTDLPPFDLDTAHKAIGTALVTMVTFSFRGPNAAPPTPDEARQFMEAVQQAVFQGSNACAEIKRMREDLTQLRDSHRPRPHADPTQPGALCEACSLTGALIAWPCGPWSTAEQILTRGQR